MISDQVKQTIGKALGRIPSGVFILTAGKGPTLTAMMASWVQQAAFDPPTVSVAVAKGRPAAAAVRESKLFTLSVLGDKDHALLKKYARGIAPGEDPFAGVATKPTSIDIPVLADALAYLECRLEKECDFGADHDLLIATVTAGQLLREGDSFTHLRGNGFHY